MIDLTDLDTGLRSMETRLDVNELIARNDAIRSMMDSSDYWVRRGDDASMIASELTRNQKLLDDYTGLKNDIAGLHDYTELMNDDELTDDDRNCLIAEHDRLMNALNAMRLDIAVSGIDYADRDAIITIHAGSGGTESENWCWMLSRMYMRYAETNDYNSDIDDVAYGDGGAGYDLLRSISIRISKQKNHHYDGMYSFPFALFSREAGRQKLIRISPFDKNHRRQTSVCSVDVIPVLDEHITSIKDIIIDPKDLKTDVFCASGPGGQCVNTTYSAVRLTHIPTGIVVSQQDERDQHRNREKAMLILKTRLLLLKQQEQKEKLKSLGNDVGTTMGGTIRNYVLYPYEQVKDTRTGCVATNVDIMLETGEGLDDFLRAELFVL